MDQWKVQIGREKKKKKIIQLYHHPRIEPEDKHLTMF